MTSFSFYEGDYKITVYKALYGWVVRVFDGSICIGQRTKLDSFEDAQEKGKGIALVTQTERDMVSDLLTSKS